MAFFFSKIRYGDGDVPSSIERRCNTLWFLMVVSFIQLHPLLLHIHFPSSFTSIPPSSIPPQSYLKNGGAGPLNANRCLGPGAPPGHASQFHLGPLPSSSSSSSNFLSNSSASLRHASSAPQRTHMALLGRGGLSQPQYLQGHAFGIGDFVWCLVVVMCKGGRCLVWVYQCLVEICGCECASVVVYEDRRGEWGDPD
jgi:hypothetical protein